MFMKGVEIKSRFFLFYHIEFSSGIVDTCLNPFRCRCIKTGVLLLFVAMDAFLSMDLTPDPASIQLIVLITCRIAIVRLDLLKLH